MWWYLCFLFIIATFPVLLGAFVELVVQPIIQRQLRCIFPEVRVKLSMKGSLFGFRDIVFYVQAIDQAHERELDLGVSINHIGLETGLASGRLKSGLYIRDVHIQGRMSTSLLGLIDAQPVSRGTHVARASWSMPSSESYGMSTVMKIFSIIAFCSRSCLQWCLFLVSVEGVSLSVLLTGSMVLSDTMQSTDEIKERKMSMNYPVRCTVDNATVSIDPALDNVSLCGNILSHLVPCKLQVNVGSISASLMQPYVHSQHPAFGVHLNSNNDVLSRYRHARQAHRLNVEYTAKFLNRAQILPSRYRPEENDGVTIDYDARDPLLISQFLVTPVLLGVSMHPSEIILEARKWNEETDLDIPLKKLSVSLGSINVTGHVEAGALGLGLLVSDIQRNLAKKAAQVNSPLEVDDDFDEIPAAPHLPCEEHDYKNVLRVMLLPVVSVKLGGVSLALTSPFIHTSLEHARLAPAQAVPFTNSEKPSITTLLQQYHEPYKRIFQPSVLNIVIGAVSVDSPGIKVFSDKSIHVLPACIQLEGIFVNNLTLLPDYDLAQALKCQDYSFETQKRGIQVSEILAIPHISATVQVLETPEQKKPIGVSITAGIAPLHVCISGILGSWLRQIFHSIQSPLTRLDDMTDAYIYQFNGVVPRVKCNGCEQDTDSHSSYCPRRGAMSIYTAGHTRLPVDTVTDDVVVWRHTQTKPTVFAFFCLPAPSALLDWRIKRQRLQDARNAEEVLEAPHTGENVPDEVSLKVGRTDAEQTLIGCGVPLHNVLTDVDSVASQELQKHMRNIVDGECNDHRKWLSTNMNDHNSHIQENSMHSQIHPYEYASFTSEKLEQPFDLMVSADLHGVVITAYAPTGADIQDLIHAEMDEEYVQQEQQAQLQGVSASKTPFKAPHSSLFYLPHLHHPTFMKLYRRGNEWHLPRKDQPGYHHAIPMFPPPPSTLTSKPLFVFICEQVTLLTGAPLTKSKVDLVQTESKYSTSAQQVQEPHLKYVIQSNNTGVVIKNPSNLPFEPDYSSKTTDPEHWMVNIPSVTPHYGKEVFNPLFMTAQSDPNFMFAHSHGRESNAKVMLPLDRDPLQAQFVLALHVIEAQLHNVQETHTGCSCANDLSNLQLSLSVEEYLQESHEQLDRTPPILSTTPTDHAIFRIPLATYSLAISPPMRSPVVHPTFSHVAGPGMVILVPVVILNFQARAFRNGVDVAAMVINSVPALSPFGKAMLEQEPLWHRVEPASLNPQQSHALHDRIVVEISSRPIPHEFVHIRLGGLQVRIPSYQPLVNGALECAPTNEFSVLVNSASLSIDSGSDEWVLALYGVALHREQHCFLTVPIATLRGGEKIFKSLRVSVLQDEPPPPPLSPAEHLSPPPLTPQCSARIVSFSRRAEEQLARSLLLTEAAARAHDLLSAHPSMPNDSSHAYTRCRGELLLPAVNPSQVCYSHTIHLPGRAKYMAVRSVNARWVCSFALADRIFKSIDHYAALILNVKYQIYAMKRPFCPRLSRQLSQLSTLTPPLNLSFPFAQDYPEPVTPIPPMPVKTVLPVHLLTHPAYLTLLAQHSDEVLQTYTRWLLRDRAPWLDEEYYHVVLDATETQVELIVPLTPDVNEDQEIPNIADLQIPHTKQAADSIPIRISVRNFQSYALPHYFCFTDVTLTPYGVPIPLLQVQQVLVERACVYPAMMNSYQHDFGHMQTENGDLNLVFTGVEQKLSKLTTIAATIPHTLHRVHDLLTHVKTDTPSVHNVSRSLGGPGYQHQPDKISPGVRMRMLEVQIVFLEDPLEVWTTKISRQMKEHRAEMTRMQLLLHLYCQSLVNQARAKDIEKQPPISSVDPALQDTLAALKNCGARGSSWRGYRKQVLTAYHDRKTAACGGLALAQMAARCSLTRCSVYGSGFASDLPRLGLFEELTQGNQNIKHEEQAQMKCLSLQNDLNRLDSDLWVKRVRAYYTAKETKARRHEDARRTSMAMINTLVLQDMAAQSPGARMMCNEDDILSPQFCGKVCSDNGLLVGRALAVHREAVRTVPFTGGYFSAAPYQLNKEHPHYALLPYTFTQSSLTNGEVCSVLSDNYIGMRNLFDHLEPGSVASTLRSTLKSALIDAFGSERFKDSPYLYPTYQLNSGPENIYYSSHFGRFLMEPRAPLDESHYPRGVVGVHWWPGARMTVRIHSMDIRSSCSVAPQSNILHTGTPQLPYPSKAHSKPGFVTVHSDPMSWRNIAFSRHEQSKEIAAILVSPTSVGNGAVHAISQSIDNNDTINSLLTPWAGNYVQVNMYQTQIQISPSIQPVLSIDSVAVNGSMQIAAYHSIRLHHIVAPVPFHVFLTNKVAVSGITAQLLPSHIFSVRKLIPQFLSLIPPIPHPSLLAGLLLSMAPFQVPSNWTPEDYLTLARTLLYLNLDVSVDKIHAVMLASKHTRLPKRLSENNQEAKASPDAPSIGTPDIPVHLTDILQMNPWYDYEGFRLPCPWLLPVDVFALELSGADNFCYLATSLRSRKHWRDRDEAVWDAPTAAAFSAAEAQLSYSRKLRLWNMTFWSHFLQRQSILLSILGTSVSLKTSMLHVHTEEFIINIVTSDALKSMVESLSQRYASVLGALRNSSMEAADILFLGCCSVNNLTMLGVDVYLSDLSAVPILRVPDSKIEFYYYWMFINNEMTPKEVPVSEFEGEEIEVLVPKIIRSNNKVGSFTNQTMPTFNTAATTTNSGQALASPIESLTLDLNALPDLSGSFSFGTNIVSAEITDESEDDEVGPIPTLGASTATQLPEDYDTIRVPYPTSMSPAVVNLSQAVLHMFMCVQVAQQDEGISVRVNPATMEFFIHNAVFYAEAALTAPSAPSDTSALVGIRRAGIAVENQDDNILYIINLYNDQLDDLQADDLFSVNQQLTVTPRIPTTVPLRAKVGKDAVLPSPLAPQLHSSLQITSQPALSRAFSFSSYSSLENPNASFLGSSWRSFCLSFGSQNVHQVMIGKVHISVCGSSDIEDSHIVNIHVETTTLSCILMDITLMSKRISHGPWLEAPRPPTSTSATSPPNIDPNRYISDWALAVPVPVHPPSTLTALLSTGKVQDAENTPFPSLGLQNTLTYLRNANLLIPLPPLCVTNLPHLFTKKPCMSLSSVYSRFYQLTSKVVPQMWSKWIREAFKMYIRKNARVADFNVPYQSQKESIDKLQNTTMAELHQLLPHLDLPASLDGCTLMDPAYSMAEIRVSVVNVTVHGEPTSSLASKKRKEVDMQRVLLNPDSRTVSLYQYQRRFAGTFLSTHRLPTDRPEWATITGEPMNKDDFKLLHSSVWEWETDWEIDLQHMYETDKEGWEYAVDYPRSYQKDRGWQNSVRRRRWIRTMRLKPGVNQDQHLFHPDLGFLTKAVPCNDILTDTDGCLRLRDDVTQDASPPKSFLWEYLLRSAQAGKRVLDPETKSQSLRNPHFGASEQPIGVPLSQMHPLLAPCTLTNATPRNARIKGSLLSQPTPISSSTPQYPIYCRPESKLFSMRIFSIIQRPLATSMPDVHEHAQMMHHTWITLICSQIAFMTHQNTPDSAPFVSKMGSKVVMNDYTKRGMTYSLPEPVRPTVASALLLSPRAVDGVAVKHKVGRLSTFTFKEHKADLRAETFYSSRVSVLSQFIKAIFAQEDPVKDFHRAREDLPVETKKLVPRLKSLPTPEIIRQSIRVLAKEYRPAKGFFDPQTLPNQYMEVDTVQVHVSSYATKCVSELSGAFFDELSTASSVNSLFLLIQLCSYFLHRHMQEYMPNSRSRRQTIEDQFKLGCGICGGSGIVPHANQYGSRRIQDAVFALRNSYLMNAMNHETPHHNPTVGNFASALTGAVGQFVRKLVSPLMLPTDKKEVVIGLDSADDVTNVFEDMPGLSQHVTRAMGIVFSEGTRHKSAVNNKREATLAPTADSGFSFIPTTHKMCPLCRSKPGTPYLPEPTPDLGSPISNTCSLQADTLLSSPKPLGSQIISVTRPNSVHSTSSSSMSSPMPVVLNIPSFLPSEIPFFKCTVRNVQIQLDGTNIHALPYSNSSAPSKQDIFASKGRILFSLEALCIMVQGHFRAPIALTRQAQPATRKRAMSLYRTQSKSTSRTYLVSPRVTNNNMTAIPESLVSESVEDLGSPTFSFDVPSKLQESGSKLSESLPHIPSDQNNQSFLWNAEGSGSLEKVVEDVVLNGLQFSRNITVADMDESATIYVLPSALQKIEINVSLANTTVSLCPGDVDVSKTSLWLDGHPQAMKDFSTTDELESSTDGRLHLNSNPLRSLFAMPHLGVQVELHPYAPLFALSTSQSAMNGIENTAKSALARSGVLLQEQQQPDGEVVMQSNTPLAHAGDAEFNSDWVAGMLAGMSNRLIGQQSHPTLASQIPEFVSRVLATEHRHWISTFFPFLPTVKSQSVHISSPVRNPYLDHSQSKHSVSLKLPLLSVGLSGDDLWLVIGMVDNMVTAAHAINILREQLVKLFNSLSGEPVEESVESQNTKNPISQDITSGVYPAWLHNAFFTPNATVLPPCEHAHLFAKAVRLFKLKLNKEYVSPKDTAISPSVSASLQEQREEVQQMTAYFENIVGAKLTQRQKLQKINTKSLLGLKDAKQVLMALTPLSPSALLLLALRLKRVDNVIRRKISDQSQCYDIDLPALSQAGLYSPVNSTPSEYLETRDNFTIYTDELMGKALRNVIGCGVLDSSLSHSLVMEKIRRAEQRGSITQHDDIDLQQNELQDNLEALDRSESIIFGKTPLYVPKVAAGVLDAAAHVHLLTQLPICRERNVFDNKPYLCPQPEPQQWPPKRKCGYVEPLSVGKSAIGRLACCGCIVNADQIIQCNSKTHCSCVPNQNSLPDTFGNASPAVEQAKTAAVQLGRLYNTEISLTLIRQCVAMVTLLRSLQLQYAHAAAAATLFVKAAKKSHKNPVPPVVPLENALDCEKHLFFVHGNISHPIQSPNLSISESPKSAKSSSVAFTAESGLQDGTYVIPVTASRWAPFINVQFSLDIGNINATMISENQPWLHTSLSGLRVSVVQSNSLNFTASLSATLHDQVIADLLIRKQAELEAVEPEPKQTRWIDKLRGKPRDKKDWIYLVAPLKRDEKSPLQAVTMQYKVQLDTQNWQRHVENSYAEWKKLWVVEKAKREAVLLRKSNPVAAELLSPHLKSLLQLTSTLLRPSMSTKWANVMKTCHHAAILAQALCPLIGPLGNLTTFIPTAPDIADVAFLPVPSYENYLLPPTVALLPRLDLPSVAEFPIVSVVLSPLLIRASRFTINKLIDFLTEPQQSSPKCSFPNSGAVVNCKELVYDLSEQRRIDLDEANAALENTESFVPEHDRPEDTSNIWMGWTSLDSSQQFESLPTQLERGVPVSSEELLVYAACHPRFVVVHMDDKHNPYHNTNIAENVPAVADTPVCCQDALTMPLALLSTAAAPGRLPADVSNTVAVWPVSSGFEPVLRSFGKVYGRKYHASLNTTCGFTPLVTNNTVTVFLDDTKDLLSLYEQRNAGKYVTVVYRSFNLGDYSAVTISPFLFCSSGKPICPLRPQFQLAAKSVELQEEVHTLQFYVSSPKCAIQHRKPQYLPLLPILDQNGTFSVSTEYSSLVSQLLLPPSPAPAAYVSAHLIFPLLQLYQFLYREPVSYYGVHIPEDVLAQILNKAMCFDAKPKDPFISFYLYSSSTQRPYSRQSMLLLQSRYTQTQSDADPQPCSPTATPWGSFTLAKEVAQRQVISSAETVAVLVQRLVIAPTVIMLSYWGSSSLEKRHVHDLENIKIVIDGTDQPQTLQTVRQWQRFLENLVSATIITNATTGLGQVQAYKFGQSSNAGHVLFEQPNVQQLQTQEEDDEAEDIINFYATY